MNKNILKQIKCMVFSLSITFLAPTMLSAETLFSISQPEITGAEAYILIDAKSGMILAEHQSNVRRDPASLTKMMTSYVVGEALKKGLINNQDEVIISENASQVTNKSLFGSSLMFLEPKKKVTVEQLNKGIIIQSGNDACIAMAEHVSGSQNVFINEMNRYANALGLKDSYFQTVHGLDAPEQYTTAHDMAFLGRALVMNLPDEYAIYSEKEFTYNNIKQKNRNGLLWDTTLTVDGLKTGHTNGAGYNLVASAVEGDTRLISVVMGTKSEKMREVESKKLLVWGFRYFETIEPIAANTVIMTPTIWYGQYNDIQLGSIEPIYLTIPRGESEQLSQRYRLHDKYLTAPIAKGDEVGVIEFIFNDKIIETKPLVALQTVEETGFFGSIWDWICLKIWLLFN